MQDQQKLRCIIIGAGVSGILIAIKLREAFGQEVDFHLFEKNDDVGGTWLENRYPGCACDVPSHIYQFSFCPNPYWSTVYASSAEIQSYLRAVVFHYGVDKHISFNSKVEAAEWDDARGTWTVSVEGKGKFACQILLNAGGILNNIAYPRLKNLDKFQGPILHTAAWNKEINLDGKRVAIVGAGASAIQTLPAIQHQVEHVDIYIRTPSWITPPAGDNLFHERNHVYTADEKHRFRDDLVYSLQTRRKMESTFNSMYKAFLRGSEEQVAIRQKLEARMKQLIKGPELQQKLIPSFEVGCRRISPGEPYLDALQQSKVEPVFDSIDEVTANGITAGGHNRAVDIIITATGFDTSFRPRFPIIGTNSTDLRQLWVKDPISYFGIAVSGFPNYLMFLGPNTPISNGSVLGVLEGTADYFIRLLKKFAGERVLSFNIRHDVQSDFNDHTQELMQKMVWTGACRSWFKTENGKVTALWPGSSLHYRQVLDDNRWEDFEWKYRGNRFAFWGQGYSEIEQNPARDEEDLAYYIKPHDPLPLEAYYLSAKGYSEKAWVTVNDHKEAVNDNVADVENLSDSSWESKIDDPEISEVAAFSV